MNLRQCIYDNLFLSLNLSLNLLSLYLTLYLGHLYRHHRQFCQSYIYNLAYNKHVLSIQSSLERLQDTFHSHKHLFYIISIFRLDKVNIYHNQYLAQIYLFHDIQYRLSNFLCISSSYRLYMFSNLSILSLYINHLFPINLICLLDPCQEHNLVPSYIYRL